jgi:MFS family permease
MWMISTAVPFLIAVQILSGAAWGANDLASFLLFVETIPREKRVHLLTVFNFANASATAAGSLLGGALLLWLGAGRETYLALFALSTLARAGALVLLLRKPVTVAHRRFEAATIPLPASRRIAAPLPSAGRIPPLRPVAREHVAGNTDAA